MNKLDKFVERLSKMGINIELVSNYPWVYLHKINNILVTERKRSEYRYTIAFLPVRIGGEIYFPDIEETFKLIRKYLEE